MTSDQIKKKKWHYVEYIGSKSDVTSNYVHCKSVDLRLKSRNELITQKTQTIFTERGFSYSMARS